MHQIEPTLQNEALALQKLLPELCPTYLPASVPRDLLALAEEEGDEGCQALLEVLAGAGQDVEECTLCGEPGEFAIDPEQRESEAAVLRTTLFFLPQYEERLIVPTRCVFACGLCRQLRATGSLIQEVATSRPEDGGDTGEGLLEHLAEVNGRGEVAEDGNLLAAWGQEVLSRAYALQTASSSIRGWKLGNPDGTPFARGGPGSAANLALQLLLPDLTAQQRDAALANALGREEDEPEAKQTNGLGKDKKRAQGSGDLPDATTKRGSSKAGGKKRSIISADASNHSAATKKKKTRQ